MNASPSLHHNPVANAPDPNMRTQFAQAHRLHRRGKMLSTNVHQ